MTSFVDRRAWVAYWDEDLEFLFLDPAMAMGGSINGSCLLHRSEPGFYIYGPYWTMPAGAVRLQLIATCGPRTEVTFDCIARDTATGEIETLAQTVFDRHIEQSWEFELGNGFESMEFRLRSRIRGLSSVCLNGLRVEHRSLPAG